MRKAPDIRPAAPEDAAFLSELALRSKAHWGYSRDFMEACRAELSVTENKVRADEFQFAAAEEENGTIVSFYALETLSDSDYELEALFVEPERIGSGVGRILVQHAIREIREKGGGTMLIQGDPNAAKFYEAAGARQIGRRQSSSIPGRFLPLFAIRIPPASAKGGPI